MSRLTLTCEGWKSLQKNTLRGFASIHIGELHLTLHDVALHRKGERMWAAPSAKPWLKGREAIVDDSGKIQYSPLVEFDSPEVRDAFSAAVIRAVRDRFPGALEMEEET